MPRNGESAKSKGPAARKTPKRARPAAGARSKMAVKKPPISLDLIKARADFVRFFIEQDFTNATGAYRRAYPNAGDATAAVESSRLLKEPNIQEALSAELEAVLAEKRRPLEKRILDTWLVRAFYDPTEILDLRGNLKITEAQLRKKGLQVCIDSINKKLNNKGQTYLEYKLADRDKALDMLRQYVQMIEPPSQKLEISGPIDIGLPPKPVDLEEAPGA